MRYFLELTDVRCLGSDTPDGRYRRPSSDATELAFTLAAVLCDSLVTV